MDALTGFLTPDQQDQIIRAIRDAENSTSGEIRLHIEDHTRKDPMLRAQEVFHKLGMNKTKMRNAVLIYIALKDHKLAIIGDKAMDEYVGNNFWINERDLLVEYFTREQYTEGIVKAIELIGIQLKKYFPYETNDRNELSDDISFHKNES